MYKRKTDKELRQLAVDMLAGQVFTDAHCENPRDVSMVFMVLALSGKEQYEQMQKDNIAMVYEYMDKAGPRSINGYPVFMSCRMLDEHDRKIVFDHYFKLKEQQEEFLHDAG